MMGCRRARNGLLLLETVAAVAVIAVVVSASALAVSHILSLRQRTFRAALAEQHLANVLEEVDAWEFDDVSADNIAQFQLPSQAVENLPGAQLVIKIDAAESEPLPEKVVARRLDVTIYWNDRSGQPRAYVSGSMWKFRGVRSGEE